MRKWLCSCVALLIATSVHAQSGKPEWVVSWKGAAGGQGENTGVHAAGELAFYMSKVLGTKVEVAPWDKADAKHLFLVTDAKRAPQEIAARLEGKPLDAFVIKYPVEIEGRRVCVLASHDDLVPDYPVYYFLTRFMDVHWVGPGELGEVVPDSPGWKMPDGIDVQESPDFELMRLVIIDNVLERRLLAGSSRMEFNHAIGSIYSPQKYGDQPDIYPLVGGKRYIPPPGKEGGNWMPCTSNPKVVDIAVKHVLDTLERNPYTRCVSLSPPDGAGNVCMCAACRAQDSKDAFADASDNPHLTDRYYRFYNAVIEKVLEKNPNAYIGVFGYGSYVGGAPSEIKVHPRIIVTQTGKLRTITEGGWEKAGVKHLALWKYVAQYQFIILRNYPHALADEIKWLKSLGGVGYYTSDPSYSAWASGVSISCYVISKLTWKADQDVDTLVDEYVTLTFGKHAAPAMRKYFDKWEEIHRRAPEEEHGDGFLYARNLLQLRNVRREDMAALDAYIAEANSSEMTEEQRKRFEMYATFYKWLRLSLEQHLLSKELDSTQWLAMCSPEEVVDTIADKQDLTAQVRKMWEETISQDRTGWLLGKYYHSKPQDHWTENEESLRMNIALSYETAAFNAIQNITERGVLESGKERTVAFWQKQLERHPRMESMIGSQIKVLKGEVPQNRLANPGFEEGEDGTPPKIPGWKTYREYGGIKDAPFKYTWKEGSGRAGSKALGIHEGLYGGIQSDPVRLEPGCYRYSFWVKTVNRPYTVDCYLLFADKSNPSRYRETKYDVQPTNGKWRRVSRIFTVPTATDYMIQFDSFWQEAGWETYLDDVELVRIW